METLLIYYLGELTGIKKVDIGTTNSEEDFLRDITGNRRFWPIYVSVKIKREKVYVM